MNDGHANKGHIGLSGTSEIAANCQGFTPQVDMTLSAIVFPVTRGGQVYSGGNAFCLATTFNKGQYYPIPFTSITLATGSGFGWLD